MVQVLYVRAPESAVHEKHITEVRWYNPTTGEVGTSNVESMVVFLRDQNGHAYTCNGKRIAEIQWVDDAPPYIRTVSDDAALDNLLSLPKF
jgi:Protein of unknown function (DUF3892)